MIPSNVFFCNNLWNYYKMFQQTIFFVMLLPLACSCLEANKPRNLLCKAIFPIFCNFYKLQKRRGVHKISARNSAPGNGCANFMGAWHFLVLSAGKPPCPQNSPFRGGFWVFLEGGGGSANFIFMGVGIFPENLIAPELLFVKNLFVIILAARVYHAGRVATPGPPPQEQGSKRGGAC